MKCVSHCKISTKECLFISKHFLTKETSVYKVLGNEGYNTAASDSHVSPCESMSFRKVNETGS